MLHRVSQIEAHCGPEAKKILVGNMSDKERERKVTIERCQQLADELGTEFIETSVKDNSNVEKVFQLLVDSILKEKVDEAAKEKPPATAETGVKLCDKSVTGTKDGWCYC